MRRFLLAVLLLLPAAVLAEPPQQQWFTALLDGRKIGQLEAGRTLRDGTVHTTQRMALVLDRAGSRVTMESASEAVETPAGAPLSFANASRLSGSATRIDGTVAGGNATVQISGDHVDQARQVPWPAGALLPEGLRLAGLRAGLTPGTRYTALAFQDLTLDAIEITTVVGPRERVDLPGGARELVRLAQTLHFPGAPVATTAWVDEDLTAWKFIMPVLGADLTLLACERACAEAPNQTSDLFERLLMKSPRPLTPAELGDGLRYTLAARNGDAARLALPQTAEQRSERQDGRWRVEIRRDAGTGGGPAPVAADRAANDWLQSGAPEIVALARRGAGAGGDAAVRMQRLEGFVRGFITTKSLGVGYASALEVARKPEGDCTEHAVLLAALARADGIAARVVTGLAYAPGFAGTRDAFVPHAWVQAWTGDRWRSYDAALDGFDAGHIALAVGDGDPWRFYAGLDTLGNLVLEAVEPVASR